MGVGGEWSEEARKRGSEEARKRGGSWSEEVSAPAKGVRDGGE